jgi:hypothetical protein
MYQLAAIATRIMGITQKAINTGSGAPDFLWRPESLPDRLEYGWASDFVAAREENGGAVGFLPVAGFVGIVATPSDGFAPQDPHAEVLPNGARNNAPQRAQWNQDVGSSLTASPAYHPTAPMESQ